MISMLTAKRLPNDSWHCQIYSHSVIQTTDKQGNIVYDKDGEPKEKRTYKPFTSNGTTKRSKIKAETMANGFTLNKNDITQVQIQVTINILSSHNSPKAVRNKHGLLSAVMATYRPDFIIKTALSKKIRPDLKTPTNEDVSRLLAIVRNTELEMPVLLAAFGPLRRGEICGLRKSDITGNIIHVKRAICPIFVSMTCVTRMSSPRQKNL